MLDEETMAKAYNTISHASKFLESVSFGSRQITAGLSGKCPVCGCAHGYGHAPKCELHRMEIEALPLSKDLLSALKTFGNMEATLMDGS